MAVTFSTERSMALPDKHMCTLESWIGVSKEEGGRSSALPLTLPAPNLSHVGVGEGEMFSPEQRHMKNSCPASEQRQGRMGVAAQS